MPGLSTPRPHRRRRSVTRTGRWTGPRHGPGHRTRSGRGSRRPVRRRSRHRSARSARRPSRPVRWRTSPARIGPGRARGATTRTTRRSGSVVPGRLSTGDVQPEGVEAVRDDEQPGVIPVDGARFVVDGRREPGRPGAPRTLEPEFGPAQRLRVGRDHRPQVHERPAGRGQGEHGRSLATPGPAPASAQGARIRHHRVVWLSGHAWPWARVSASTSAARRTSAIGATMASARVRRVAGGTGKTAVGSPAAAHTIG